MNLRGKKNHEIYDFISGPVFFSFICSFKNNFHIDNKQIIANYKDIENNYFLRFYT